MQPDLSALRIPRDARPGPVGALFGCLVKIAALAGIVVGLFLGWAEAERRGYVAELQAQVAPPPPPPPPPAPGKKVARSANAPLMAPVLGYVVAKRKAAVGFARSGKIKEVLVDVGRSVKANEPIARLDDAIARAEMERVRVQLEDARRELARREAMAAQDVGATIERDQQRSKVEVLKAELKLAEETLALHEIVAPFDGVVIAKQAEVGETVGVLNLQGGQGAVATIADLSEPEVEADVPEARIEELKPDQLAEVELDALAGVKLKGKLRLVLPTADRRKATVPVRVTLLDRPPRIRADMSARVTFVLPPSARPVVEDEPVVVAAPPPPPPPTGAERAIRVASSIAARVDADPRSRQVVLGAIALVALSWTLGFVRRVLRHREQRVPQPSPKAAPKPPPKSEDDTASLPKVPEKKPTSTRTRHSRASFRVLKRDSISDVESVEEIYVLEDEAPSERQVLALGASGRMGGEPWFLHRTRGEKAVLSLGGVDVAFEVEGDIGARLYPSPAAEVRIEDVKVPRDGAPLVHGMVFTVDGRPYVYLDRTPNEVERRRTFVVAVDERTDIEGKVLEDAEPEPEPPRAPRTKPRWAGADAGAPIVSVRSLEKTYTRGRHEVPVLRGLDLDIEAGEFLALMGPSGSGKSTLLHIVAGLDRPTQGLVSVAGEEISNLSESRLARWRSRTIGFVFQFYNLIPVLDAFENVELPLLLTDLSRGERRKHAERALDLVGLKDRARHLPRELSGGQEQRVAIARAIVTDPALIVADEPTGDLDAENADAVLSLLGRLNSELGKTIVMVTHDPRAAARARRVQRLEKGVLADD